MNPGEIAEWEFADGVFRKVRVLVPLGASYVKDVLAVFLRLDNNTRTIVYRNGQIREGLPG